MPHPDAMTTCCRLKSSAWPPAYRPPDNDDDEEFFEAASPEASSAATEEGRAKLYELLQQHANDDAHEVFYDVEACCEPPQAPEPPADDPPVPNGHVVSPTKLFAEDRPLITRSTSLKTGKTPPDTPSRKKIVRFADVLGLDLEDVRHIISGDLPNVPSSAFDDLKLDEAPRNVPQEVPQRVWAGEASSGVVSASNALYPKFAMPGHQPDFLERVRSRGVCLESVVVAEFTVQGSCRVMNWGFNKRVVVRYTTNRWASSSDIPASHVAGSTRDGTDSFAFNLFLTPYLSGVEFALRYDVNGREHWDNNGGDNYRLSRHGEMTAHAVSVPCSPTWMQDFW